MSEVHSGRVKAPDRPHDGEGPEGVDRGTRAPLQDVAIVGGGILGMTLALRLHDKGMRVTLIEAAPMMGGLTQSQTLGGFTWDRFYHVILFSDSYLRDLLEDLGLTHLLCWRTTRTGFYIGGKLHSVSDAFEFLRFSPLSICDKIRLAGTILYASRIRDWQRLERIPVTDWLCRLSGQRTFERIWLPLLRSKLGENYRQASAAFIWAIIARMYAARRSELKREMFGYVQGGYNIILQTFRTRLERLGVRILSGRPVSGVRDLGDRVEVRLNGAETYDFDRVVLTVACGQVVSICPDLTASERQRLNSVVYQGVVCASLLLRKPLAGFYITNITDSWIPFTGVIEMTALVDPAAFGGNTLVYLPKYLTQGDSFWKKTDVEIKEIFLAALERMYPHFERGDVLAFQVARVRDMLAVTTLNYSERSRPPLRTSLPNVFLVNSAQIVNGTLNVNETLALANSSADELRSVFRVRRPSVTPSRQQ